MENSPGSSSNGSPDRFHPPAYFRLSSLVTEKPESVADPVYEEHQDHRESGNVTENRPLALPHSPSNSHKSDSEGNNRLLPSGGFMSSMIPGFTLSFSIPSALSSDAEQGDVDEGFDEGFEEEFEDRDVGENEPKYFQLGDLDPKELQQLLDDPQLPNLEDFDLGVDVSIRPPGPYNLSHPPSSSPYHPPNSPYQAMVTTSPAPAMELGINQLYNDYNLSESFFGEDPPSVQSNVSALTNTSHGTDELSLTMLTPDSNMDSFPAHTTSATLDPQRTPSPISSAPYHHSTPSPYQHQSSPVLTTAATGLDLAETSNLLSTDTLIELSAALTAEDGIVDTQSMYMFGNGTAQLNLLPQGSNQQNGVGLSVSAAQVTTLLDSSMFPMSSQASQTYTNRNGEATPPPSPSRTFSRSHQSNHHASSPSPSPSPKPEMSSEDQKLVEMPYYQFRKLLDDPTIAERRKEEIKNIRRRGRNKTAAKLCRNKKLQMIMGLEQEVEQLRKTKSMISVRTQSLERQIAELKKRCHNRSRVGTIS